MRATRDGGPGPDPLLLGVDAAVLFLLLAGGQVSFLTAYRIAADLWGLTAACGGMALVSAALWHQRRGGRAALAAGGLWAFLSWSFRREIFLVLGYIFDMSWGHPDTGSLEFYLRSAEAGQSLLPVLILFVTVGLGLLLGWLVVRRRCWYLAAAAVLLPVLPAMLGGALPSLPALMAQTAGWGTLLLTSLFDRRRRRSLGRAELLSLVGLYALLGLLALALPMEGYTRPQWATDARGEIVSFLDARLEGSFAARLDLGDAFTQWVRDMGLPLFPSGGGGDWSGELDDGGLDLTDVGPRRYSGISVLTVTTDQPDPGGRTYLRGTAAGTYTGQRWEPLDESGVMPPDVPYWPALSAQGTAASTMTIRHVDPAGTTAYVPYRLSRLPADVALTGTDGVWKEAGRASYDVSYVPGGPEDSYAAQGPSPDDSQAGTAAGRYLASVYSRYRQVPEAAAQALRPLLDQLEAQEIPWPEDFPLEHQSAVATARRTAALLSRLAVYDLSAPAMEEGEDFAAHFLETGRGYCVHFATAGALLLRLEGIPARFVSGYTVDLNGLGRGVVADSAAHAWVEIWLDGYGWYPVEMTPGYRDAAVPGADAGVDFVPVDPPPEGPDEDPLPQRPTPQQPEDPEAGDGPETGVSPGPGEGTGGGLDLSWLRWAAGALLLLAAPALLYRGAWLYRRRRRDRPDTNGAVIDAYRRYRRLLPWGCGEDKSLESLARKAKFSQHTLTEEERSGAWRRLDLLAGQTQRLLPWWKRWCFLLLRPLF